jgi:3-hydroxyisobutyrate dehydrogenase-like beta-hydroxyacid dehydrogenase
MRVGFLGLGNMGLPMAANLLRAGFELCVWNRTPSKAQDLARLGASVASSPAEVASGSDLVCACLANEAASRSFFLGPQGLLASALPGQIFADHGTVDLATTSECHAAAAARGCAFLDAPLSGGPVGAREGTLSIMVGGDEAAFVTALPAFQAMGSTVLRMGRGGSGTLTKLVNQLLVGIHSVASCEALLLAREAGVDSDKLLHVLSKSWGASRMLERNAPFIAKREFEASAAPLRNLRKDLAIILDLAKTSGVQLPLGAQALALYSALENEGKGSWDVSAVTRLLEDLRGRS